MTKPAESVETEEESTKPTEGELPSNDLTETTAGSEEETTEAPAESSAPAESEPESSEESSAPTEEESTTAAESEEESYEAASDEETTPEETAETAEEPTEAASDEETTTATSEEETPAPTEEAPKTVYAVSTYCDPEKGGKISISDSEVKEGEDLQFTVTVNDGYVLELVYVNDEEAEASDVNDTETVYHYVVEDVDSDIDIEAHFAEAEEEEAEKGFEAELSMDGITFMVTADAGVLPEGAKARIISLEEAADIDADAVKEEVLDAEGVTEEEEPLYAAYRIELLDAEDEVLSDEDIKGEVKVSISGLESMSEEEASEPSIYKVEASPVTKDSAANADVFSAPNRAPRLMTLEADTDADAEKDLDVKKIGDKTSMGGATLDVAVLAAPAPRAVDFESIDVYLGNNEIEGEFGGLFPNHKWTVVDKDGKPTTESLISLENSSDRTVNVNIDYTCPFGSVFYIKHSYNIFGQKEEYFQVTVVKGEQKAYFYIKKDPTAPDSDSAKDYMYWGTGSVPLGPASENSDVKHEPLEGKPWKDDIEIPKDLSFSEDGYDQYGYPILTDGSTSYYSEYSKASEGNSYYTIKWNKFTVASGAVGADGTTPLEGTYHWEYDLLGRPTKQVNDPTWHIDADVTFHDESKIQIVAGIQNVSTIGNTPTYTELFRDMYGRDINFEEELSGKTEGWESQYQNDISKAESKGYELKWYIEIDGERHNFDLSKINDFAAQENPRIDRIDIVGVYEKTAPTPVTVTFVINGGKDRNVGYMTDANGDKVYEVAISDLIPGDELTKPEIFDEFDDDGETLYWDPTITKVPSQNEIYYAICEKDGNNDKIPDKFQIPVYFRAEHGELINNGNHSVITIDGLSLLSIWLIKTNDEGIWDENGSHKLTKDDIPGIGTPDLGYQVREDGLWTPTLLEQDGSYITISDSSNNEYVYKFEPISTKVTFKIDQNDQGKGNLGTDAYGTTIYEKEVIVEATEKLAAPEVVDVEGDNFAFIGWFKEGTEEQFTGATPADGTVYVAKFGLDDDQDNIPDEYEVSVKFVIKNGYYTDPDTQEKKTKLERSYGLRDANGNYSLSGTATVKVGDAPTVIADAGYTKDGVTWNPALPLPLDKEDDGKVVITFTCVLADGEKDENEDGKPDSQQILVKFDLAGQAGAIFDPAIVESATVKVVDGNVYYDVTEAGTYPKAPGVKVDLSQKKVFDAWVGEDGSSAYPEGGSIDPALKGRVIAYLATYLDDIDGDSVADKYQEPAATIAPYETTIYVGGSNVHDEDGFPNLDMNLSSTTSGGETVDRPVDVTNISKIYINGVEQETTDIDSLFRAVYVYEDSTGVHILENDAAVQDDMDQDATQQAGEYTIAVALSDQVKLEDDGTTTYNAGISLLADDTDAATTTGDGFTILNGRPMLARQADAVMIEAESGQIAKVEFTDDILKVRPVSDVQSAANDDIHRPILNSEAEIAASPEIDKDKAFAVVESDNYTVNNNADRPVMDTSEVHLLVDNILPQTATDTADRLGSLKEKANQELGLGMSAEEADAAGYNYEIMYLDLVDGNNGNAWVAAEGGSDIYWPYPDEVKDNYNDYEFKFVHYKDLHREYNLENQSAIDAIAGADVEIIIPEKTEHGLKFHTDKAGFSPFALVWNDAGNFDGTGTDDPGTDDPGTGGGTASNPTGSGDATPSGPVSVQQSGNSKGYYYTAGLHGNWVHMDNVDMNVPLDEPVPAGATAVDFPEWHRWRFYLSSGVMLDNQWAHIENPYAVGDQPRSGWFYFDHDGLMRYGWYLDTRSGDWYYMHSESDGMLGTMMTGWHYDSHDNRWYYLDPQSGAMKTGWQNIGGKWYYFNPTPFGETWSLDHSSSVWRFNGNTVRPYGSMYQNEVTPDGYKVGEDGAWIQ